MLACVSNEEFASQFSWTSCTNYTIDRSLRDADNMRGEPWETAATEFELFCGNEEINALLTFKDFIVKLYTTFPENYLFFKDRTKSYQHM